MNAEANGMSYGRDLIERLGGWMNQLAAPLMPPILLSEGHDSIRLDFQHRIPHSVMIGKSVRAVSGIKAALVLAELGYVTECGALLRMVSDFCTEVDALGKSLDAGGELPAAVRAFTDQYFTPKARTPEQFAAQDRIRYVSREELMKAAGTSLASNATIEAEQLRINRRFLNLPYYAYVHGAAETTMELWDAYTGAFMVSGHSNASIREEFIEAVFLKLHEVIVALEYTAAVTSHAEVFAEVREARHTMDALDPWKPLGV
jgi:hypothetical protein